MRIAFFCFLLILTPAALGVETISIHPTNFFMLGKGKEIYYPFAVNADFLLNPNLSSNRVEETLAQWEKNGVNTLRVRVDALHAPGAPLRDYLQKDGSFQEPVLSPLDSLLNQAERYSMTVILVLFDLQTMDEQWSVSPYHYANGGSCEQVSDWFRQPEYLKQSLARTDQLIQRYTGRNILAWEVARGANLWDLEGRPNNKLMEGVSYWVVRVGNQILQSDPHHHLTALSFAPNSYPDILLGLPQIQVHFLELESNDAQLAGQSASPYIDSVRSKYKKPVFIAEAHWKGDAGARDSLVYNVFWSAFASCSGLFLTPMAIQEGEQVSNADFNLFRTLHLILPDFDLSGVPRSIVSPATLDPPDTFYAVETILGFDRLFWIQRKSPAQSTVQIHLLTVEGIYGKEWFDPNVPRKYPLQEFAQVRKNLIIQTPEFERGLLGVLRLIKRAPEKVKPPDKSPAADGG